MKRRKHHTPTPAGLLREGETFEAKGQKFRIVAVWFDRTVVLGYWAVPV